MHRENLRPALRAAASVGGVSWALAGLPATAGLLVEARVTGPPLPHAASASTARIATPTAATALNTPKPIADRRLHRRNNELKLCR
jgi:hypothetical protein